MTETLHRAFGLTISSNWALTALPAVRDGPAHLSVLVHHGCVPDVERSEPAWRLGIETWWRTREGWLIHYQHPRLHEAWSMRVNVTAAELEILATSGIPVPDVLAVVESIGVASYLAAAGVPLLHAAAVEIDGRAILLLGQSGAGKSTIAGALVASGCPLLSDDVAAITQVPEGLRVQPGGRRLRLSRDSARAAGWDPAGLAHVFVTLPYKCQVELSEQDGTFQPRPLPIAAMYLVQALDGEPAPQRPRVRALRRSAGLSAMLRNTFGHALAPRSGELLTWWTRLADECPVKCVSFPHDLSRLDSLAAAIMADACAL